VKHDSATGGLTSKQRLLHFKGNTNMNQEKRETEATTDTDRIITEALDRARAGHQEEKMQQDDQVATPQVTMTATTAIVINEARKQELESKFHETISNPRFWAKEARFDTLMDNLEVPMFDDRSLQQFYIHAMSDLTGEAAALSHKKKVPVVMPTEEEGKAEAWKRYIAKATLTAVKAFKKDKVTFNDEMIQAAVKVELDKLTDKQDI